MHSAEKARDTALNDEKYDVRCGEGAWDMRVSVLVAALCITRPKLSLRTTVTTSHVTCLVLMVSVWNS